MAVSCGGGGGGAAKNNVNKSDNVIMFIWKWFPYYWMDFSTFLPKLDCVILLSVLCFFFLLEIEEERS